MLTGDREDCDGPDGSISWRLRRKKRERKSREEGIGKVGLSRRKEKGKEKETRMDATKQLGSGDDRDLGVRSIQNWKG